MISFSFTLTTIVAFVSSEHRPKTMAGLRPRIDPDGDRLHIYGNINVICGVYLDGLAEINYRS